MNIQKLVIDTAGKPFYQAIDLDLGIKHFFHAPPETGIGLGNVRSGLFMIRRDLRDLSGPEASTPRSFVESSAVLKTPILGCVGIFAGLEVLATIYKGQYDPGSPGVISSLSDLGIFKKDEITTLLTFRNAIVHGYNLDNVPREIRRKKVDYWYRFTLDDDPTIDTAISLKRRDEKMERYTISFWQLRNHFFEAIRKLRTMLLDGNNRGLRSNFFSVAEYIEPYKMRSYEGQELFIIMDQSEIA
jgi:hypothetical protein